MCVVIEMVYVHAQRLRGKGVFALLFAARTITCQELNFLFWRLRSGYHVERKRTSVSPPPNEHFIRPEALRTCGISQLCLDARSVLQQTRVRNHDTVVNTEHLVSRKHIATPISCHHPHHLL